MKNIDIDKNDFNIAPYKINGQSNESSNMKDINDYFRNHYNL